MKQFNVKAYFVNKETGHRKLSGVRLGVQAPSADVAHLVVAQEEWTPELYASGWQPAFLVEEVR